MFDTVERVTRVDVAFPVKREADKQCDNVMLGIVYELAFSLLIAPYYFFSNRVCGGSGGHYDSRGGGIDIDRTCVRTVL